MPPSLPTALDMRQPREIFMKLSTSGKWCAPVEESFSDEVSGALADLLLPLLLTSFNVAGGRISAMG